MLGGVSLFQVGEVKVLVADHRVAGAVVTGGGVVVKLELSKSIEREAHNDIIVQLTNNEMLPTCSRTACT